jgi:hypothetical protein
MAKSRRTTESSLPTASSAWSLDVMPGIPIAAVFSFLQDMRGYVQKTETREWLTTASGEIVSGSKSPRFSPANIDQALSALSARIADINSHTHSEFTVNKAVAFGDFLKRPPKCQAANVAIELRQRVPAKHRDKTEERKFLKQIAAKNRFLHLQPYEEWMSQRSHRRLVMQ